jgi:hypothetical protein
MVYSAGHLLIFDQWNFRAGGWERVPCTAIVIADWQTKKTDALLLQRRTQKNTLRQLQTVTNHVHRDAFVHGRHQYYHICELLHLEKM